MEDRVRASELALTTIDEFDAIMIEIRGQGPPLVQAEGNTTVKYPAKLHARKAAKALGVDAGVIYLKGEITRQYEDTDMGPTFHQRRYFYYITGANIEDCAATYDIAGDHLVLWLPYKDPRQELYVGTVPTPEECQAASDLDAVGQVKYLTPYLLSVLSPTTPLYILHENQAPKLAPGVGHPVIIDSTKLQPAMDRAREIKTPYEIDMVRRANEISSVAHRAVMEGIGRMHSERDVEAAFISSCLVNGGARNQAYEVIAASGSNAATLHYDKNDQPLTGKQLLVIDAGAEWKRYASDITRTIPLGDGRGGVGFTPQAAAIYAIVEKMQEECIKLAGPGVAYRSLQVHAQRVAVEELLKIGILKGSNAEGIISAGTISAFFPHGLGHHIGLDTHDVSSRHLLSLHKQVEMLGKRELLSVHDCQMLHIPLHPYDEARQPILEPGMIVTVEPGIYFCRSWLEAFFLRSPVHSQFIDKDVLEGFFDVGGVRIEDCILITEDGYENLTTAPKGEEMLKIIRDAAAEPLR